MESNINESVLEYINENRGFRYTEGEAVLTGNKLSVDGTMRSVDGGSIQKNGAYVGNFNVSFVEDNPKISLYNVDASQFIAMFGIVTNLLEKLAE